jgi:hypothetical protein
MLTLPVEAGSAVANPPARILVIGRILDEELPVGPHNVAIPDEVPTQASFATVSVGPSAHRAFIVGPMPSGTTMARFPDPSNQ